MPRCLITGATGFIGPRLAPVLQQAGGEVRCLVRSTADRSALEALDVEYATGDVTQPDSLATAVAGVDFVFHLAGRTAANNYNQFAAVNEAGCTHVAAACATQPNPPVLVVVSSLAAAGPSVVGQALTESDSANPISNYGRSKLAGELAARQWAAQMPICIVRPPVVFGPGDRAGLVIVRAISKSGVHVIHRTGLPLSLIHADDLANALLLVARYGERLDPTDPRGTGTYYAADPAESSYAEMGQMIAQGLERTVRVLKVRKWVLGFAAGYGEMVGRLSGKPMPMNCDKLREGTASGWVASPAKLINQTGFKPARSLADRYKETIEWYRRTGWLAEK